MASNKGLQFNPSLLDFMDKWTGGSTSQEIENSTKETPGTDPNKISIDYLSLPTKTSLSVPSWNKDRFKESSEFFQTAVNNPEEFEDETIKAANRWNKGYYKLDEEEKKRWEEENREKIGDHDEEWKERLWKNQQFVNNITPYRDYNIQLLNSLNASQRDKLYDEAITSNAVSKRYGVSDNSPLQQLTPEGKRDLLQSDYKGDKQVELEHYGHKFKGDSAADEFTTKEKWDAALSLAPSRAVSGAWTGIGIGGTSAGLKGSGLGAIVGATVGGLWGLGEGFVAPENSGNMGTKKQKADEEIVNSIILADDKRKKEDEDVVSLTREISRDLFSRLNNHELSDEDIDRMYDEMALNGEREYTDELGYSHKYQYIGSNHYSAFKDTSRLKDYGTWEKVQALAQTKAIAQKYGKDSAMRILDEDVQKYVSNAQSGWLWGGHTLRNIAVGGTANLALSAIALGSLFSFLYGNSGLSEYLEGNDSSGNGDTNFNIWNPQYWEKVDQYNTFRPKKIREFDANGGISTYNNIPVPGEEESAAFLANEAFKMCKFVWSDGIKAWGLGMTTRGLTTLAGGQYIAPGILAKESSILAKVVNEAGAIANVNASSLGIDMAYGIQTYNDVRDQNYEKVDQIVDIDARKEAENFLKNPSAIIEFEKMVEAENARRKANAGETGLYTPVDKEKAWNDYAESVYNRMREEKKVSHEEDYKEARKSAAIAFKLDATLEHLRNSASAGLFRSYLFDKGTKNALGQNNYGVNTAIRNGEYVLGKNALHKKAMETFANNLWGGFHSNYYDDVTVGLATGMGLQDYNNYLLSKYNPAAYANVMDDYVNPIIAGIAEADDAARSHRAFLDGTIGGLGAMFSVGPNYMGISSNISDALTRSKEDIAQSENSSSKEAERTWYENVSMFLTHPLLQAYAEAKEATRLTEKEINEWNKAIKENGYPLEKIQEAATDLNMEAIARQGTSVREAEDAKDRKVFTIASQLLELRDSAAEVNAQIEPDRATWSKKKKAAATIWDGLKAMAGIKGEHAETPYTRAMQALNDAATIDEAPEDESQAVRRQQLVDTFLGLDDNQNAIEKLSESEKQEFAKKRLKKNAQNILSMIEELDKYNEASSNSIVRFDPQVNKQLAFMFATKKRTWDRLIDLEGVITGQETTIEDLEKKLFPVEPNKETVLARYGSLEGYKRVENALEKAISQAKASLDHIKNEEQIFNSPDNPIKNAIEREKTRLIWKLARENAEEKVERLNDDLERVKKEGEKLEEATKESFVLSAEQILQLPANERYRMLDDYFIKDYTKEQQKEIERAKDKLIEDGTPLVDALERVRDAAVLTHRVEENKAAIKKIMKNPGAANLLVERLKRDRATQIVRYFNDKISADALEEVVNTRSLSSVEEAKKALQDYSTAILNGMKSVAKESTLEYDHITISNLLDAIDEILKDRKERGKETESFKDYLNKVSKVDSYKVNIPTYDDGTKGPATLTKEGRDLSENDRTLLEYALDYANERGLKLKADGADNTLSLEKAVETDDFKRYINERNHSYTVQNNGSITAVDLEAQSNPVSNYYLGALISDALNSYDEYKKTLEKENKKKTTAGTPKSVATPPVEATDHTTSKESPATDEKPTKEEDNKAEKKGDNILDNLGNNESLHDDIEILLEELDKKAKSSDAEAAAENIKDFIRTQMESSVYSKIEDLQKDILLSTVGAPSQEEVNLANHISGLNIKGIRDKRAEDAKAEDKGKNASDNNTENEQKKEEQKTPEQELTTVDLEVFLKDPDKYKSIVDYIKSYNIPNILQKLSDYLRPKVQKGTANAADSKKAEMVNQARVVFLYDSQLGAKVKGSMSPIKDSNKFDTYKRDSDAPVIMAIELKKELAAAFGISAKEFELLNGSQQGKDRQKEVQEILENHPQLIHITDRPDHYSSIYIPIGIMPANTNNNSGVVETASVMGYIRKGINYDEYYLGKTPIQIIRYPGMKTPIQSTITEISVPPAESTDNTRPETGVKIKPSDALALFEQNAASATEQIVEAAPGEAEELQALEKSGNRALEKMKKNSLYQRIKAAFIKRLVNITYEIKNSNADNGIENRAGLGFKLLKGSKDAFSAPVYTKPISETVDRNDRDTLIIDRLRAVSPTNTATATALIESNSRFKGLYDGLTKLRINSSNIQGGDKAVKGIQDVQGPALEQYANSFKTLLRWYFNISDTTGGPDVEARIEGENLKVTVKIGDQELSTLTTKLDSVSNDNFKISEAEFAVFMKDLILDKDNNVRINKNDYDVVKWQVSYEDIAKLYNPSINNDQKTSIRASFGDMFDDGIFEIRTTKLAYSASSAKASLTRDMRAKFGLDATPEVSNPVMEKASGKAEAKDGEIDANSGLKGQAPTNTTTDDILSKLGQKTKDKIDRMIMQSENRQVTDDKHFYEIEGKKHARVTSIKTAIKTLIYKIKNKIVESVEKGYVEKFDKNSLWTLPSTAIGDSFDDFGRDVFNNSFEEMSDDERLKEFDSGYTNSTKENYSKVYSQLMDLRTHLLSLGQAIVSTTFTDEKGEKHQGKITAKGELALRIRDKEGNIREEKVRAAGTIDVLAVDANGDFYLYDFKTHRGDLDKFTAANKGYNLQLSMYAAFLEKEYGIKIEGIYLIPVKVAKYPTPKNEGDYTLKEKSKTQLIYRGDEFLGADFNVEDIIELKKIEEKDLVVDEDMLEDYERAEAVIEGESNQDANTSPEEKTAEQPVQKSDDFEHLGFEEIDLGALARLAQALSEENTGEEAPANKTPTDETPSIIGEATKDKMEEIQEECKRQPSVAKK